METELKMLNLQETWELVPYQKGMHVIGCKWVYKLKKNPDGSIFRHKAHLVAKGYLQQPRVDMFETFSLVLKHTTLHTILAITVNQRWDLRQFDFESAFLHGELHEIVHMNQPPGFVSKNFPNHICKMKKAIYSLRQVLRTWYEKFSSVLHTYRFVTSPFDPSLYIFIFENISVFILLYVDDIIITRSHSNTIQDVISILSA
jgi:histone deacetylase 1/2